MTTTVPLDVVLYASALVERIKDMTYTDTDTDIGLTSFKVFRRERNWCVTYDWLANTWRIDEEDRWTE